MSVLKRTIQMFVMAALAVTSQIGFSQDGYHPFSESMDFDPDWQFFAPVQLQDLQDLTARQRANTGFFLTYDRLYIGVNRSDTESASFKMDYGWGNRFDFGWMKNNESGWMFSASTLNGPNAYNNLRQLRLNQYVTAANGGDGPGTPGGGGGGGTTNPFVPNEFRNDEDQTRVYTLQDSLNVGSYANFEANKVWRLEPYRYGGILEPMVGLRYTFFGDTAHNDTYNSFAILNNATPPAVIANGETILRNNVDTNNYMLLGQIGFRYTKFINRWTLSNDMKFFGGHVYQNQETSFITTTTTYPNPIVIGNVSSTEGDTTGSAFSGRRHEGSTVGFDLRVEGSYKATRYLDIRGGFTMAYFHGGIWRGVTSTQGGNTDSWNQNLVMPGFTFGLALNR